jgi:S1-C subfamily serine protease
VRRVAALVLSAAVLASVGAGVAQTPTEEAARAVVRVKSFVPRDARTAAILGTEREGNGVVVDASGLVLTVGYLIVEAMAAEITDHTGQTVVARILAYDHETGFGLLRADPRLAAKAIALGTSSAVAIRDRVLVAGHPTRGGTQEAVVVSRRAFAGPWEYLLEDAIFTSPPHAGFGGAALVDRDGKLIGIGSLFLQEVLGEGDETKLSGNMFVPIDLLKPILADLRDQGRVRRSSRPWLGIRGHELLGRLFVQSVVPDSPAAHAGIATGDIVIAVGQAPLEGTLADFYRRVWALGPAGVDVPLTVLQGNVVRELTLKSADRYKYLKLNPSL